MTTAMLDAAIIAQPQPTAPEQAAILATLRELDMDQIEELYHTLSGAGIISFPPADPHNERRRQHRHRDYIVELREACWAHFAQLDNWRRACDIGCGDGQIAVALFQELLATGGELHGCDVVDYRHGDARDHIRFELTDGLSYLLKVPDNHFDVMLEVVALHHLPSLDDYRRYMAEMIRATRPGGLIVFVETTHTTWREHLANAVLDILLNDRTSRTLTGTTERAIPVPVQFLSHREIQQEIWHNDAGILAQTSMPQTPADPKKHIIYVCQKQT